MDDSMLVSRFNLVGFGQQL